MPTDVLTVALVINLNRSVDRWTLMDKRVRAAGLCPVRLVYTYIKQQNLYGLTIGIPKSSDLS